MEQTPYLKTDLPANDVVLAGKLDSKLSYIDQIKRAVSEGDDRLIYELLDSKKYNLQIKKTPHAGSNRVLSVMIDDLQDDLSHYLAAKLVDYLSERFPFFYYEESQLGVFQLYFGNWWDRRHFGVLDPLTVGFIFDDAEYEQLSKAVELSAVGQRYHAQVIADTTRANEELQRILAEQETRNAERVQLQAQLAQLDEKTGIFGNRQNAEQRDVLQARLDQLNAIDAKARQVPSLIAENNAQILNYSKEDTILIYEQRAISETFGDFSSFQAAVENLYVDYVSTLANSTPKGADSAQSNATTVSAVDMQPVVSESVVSETAQVVDETTFIVAESVVSSSATPATETSAEMPLGNGGAGTASSTLGPIVLPDEGGEADD